MTPEKLLAAARHYLDDAFAVAVFEHGTVIGVAHLAEATKVMSAYNVPNDGEGQTFSVAAPDELEALAASWRAIPRGRTEALLILDSPPGTPRSNTPLADMHRALILAHAGSMLRANRSRDARELKIVAQWSPSSAPALKLV